MSPVSLWSSNAGFRFQMKSFGRFSVQRNRRNQNKMAASRWNRFALVSSSCGYNNAHLATMKNMPMDEDCLSKYTFETSNGFNILYAKSL